MIALPDFLGDELKITSSEINDLGIVKVTQPKKDDCDKVYVHFNDKQSVNYILRSKVDLPDLKLLQFIPPQLFEWFAQLSKNTYLAGKSYEQLKRI